MPRGVTVPLGIKLNTEVDIFSKEIIFRYIGRMSQVSITLFLEFSGPQKLFLVNLYYWNK